MASSMTMQPASGGRVQTRHPPGQGDLRPLRIPHLRDPIVRCRGQECHAARPATWQPRPEGHARIPRCRHHGTDAAYAGTDGNAGHVRQQMPLGAWRKSSIAVTRKCPALLGLCVLLGVYGTPADLVPSWDSDARLCDCPGPAAVLNRFRPACARLTERYPLPSDPARMCRF